MATSKTCPIDGSESSIAEALREAGAFAQYTGLAGKQALHLRLLAEELLGVARGAAEVEEGSFVITNQERSYRLQLSAAVQPLGEEARKKLLHAASSGKNALYEGVTGKLRMVADWYRSGLEETGPMNMYVESGFPVESTDFRPLWEERDVPGDWSLHHLIARLEREQKAEEWDELECSVLARLADDVQVGFRNRQVVVSVYKDFSE